MRTILLPLTFMVAAREALAELASATETPSSPIIYEA